jgi:hypothetical protein
MLAVHLDKLAPQLVVQLGHLALHPASLLTFACQGVTLGAKLL